MHAQLGPYLDALVRDYGPGYLGTDPLGEVRSFRDPDNLEVAGFLAAGLSFGRVEIILAHLRDLWDRLEHRPAALVDAWSAGDGRRVRGFRHRWVRDVDLAAVLAALGRTRRRHGSLRALFVEGYDPGEADLRGSLARFVDGIRREVRIGGRRLAEPELPRGVRTFLSDPGRGGACKRLNLYLRWLVRPDDGVDLGLLPGVRTDQLVVPLDTHVARLGHNLGLTRRRTPDWKMAGEITDALRRFDPVDPVRYDFALSRLGILDRCPRRVDAVHCRACSLLPVCIRGKAYRGARAGTGRVAGTGVAVPGRGAR
jgi:uncharacterized protein (TIGR02757 family)